MKSGSVRAMAGAAAAALVLVSAPLGAQHAVRRAIDDRPAAVIDLRTDEGIAVAHGAWRYHDADIVSARFNAAGADLKPSGAAVNTFDISPKAGVSGFDDSRWPVVQPASLENRRTNGRLSFGWYRTAVTIPPRVGAFDTSGSTVVFEIVVDDYAEVWVDGKLPRVLGQTGGSLIDGFNAPNRVVLTTNAEAGQTFHIAVLGVNGPLADPPANYVWIRSATLDFYNAGATAGQASPVRIVRNDPSLEDLVPDGLAIEKLAGDFRFTEGPVWAPDGYLLFSDPNSNTIYRWSDTDAVSVYRTKSGYSGVDVGEYGQPGSNGLTFDAQGRLTIAEHGRRRISRIEKNGTVTVLADRFQGKRLNSPNDLVYRSDGSLYFTDPPFGLPKFFDDPRKELSYSGVYRWSPDGQLQLLTTEMTGPNGIAFSPDERVLYVGDWDEKHKVVMRYDVRPDGSVANGRVFFDMTSAPGEDAIDGLKVDALGNVYISGPGGLWIVSPDGRHLGTLAGPEHPHNLAWGDADRRTLYLTAQTGLYRIRLNVPGAAAPSAHNETR